MNPTPADFTSAAYLHQIVSHEIVDHGECRRFHLSFAYLNSRGSISRGDQIVLTRDIGQAAVRIAADRGLNQVFVLKRHFSGRPASESETVNTVFDIKAEG